MELTSIKGIGPKLNEILKSKGISDVESLVSFFPVSYNTKSLSGVSSVNFNAKATIASDIEVTKPKTVEIVSFDCIIDNNMYKAKGFNMSYISKTYKIGDEIIISGTYDAKYRQILIKKIYNEKTYTEGIEAIYNLEGVNNPTLSKAIRVALDNFNEKPSIIPKEYYLKHNYKCGKALLESMHFPKTLEEANLAKDCIKYHELLNFALKMEAVKSSMNALRREPIKYDIDKIKELISSIEFELTPDQKRSVNDILKAFNSTSPLNMLLEGDVGSGKTIVSVIASYAVVTAFKQALVFAPTEALAKQHFETYKKYLEKFNVNVRLLTSSIKTKERNEILESLKNGDIDIIIGTHSLLSDEVVFKDLAFAVLDEQHKAGVNQRKKLREKGECTDLLYMSATPIPRTLALSFFSDLTLEEIRSERARGNTKTFVHTYKEYLKILDFTKKQIEEGRQAYFVCPIIDDNPDSQLTSVLQVKSDLEKYLPDLRIGLLHGRLTDQEKSEVLEKFMKGEIDILVSTTVIEVGIDNKNATIMVVIDAYRFGLSQLHQLRGRVGRGIYDSYCYLMVESMEDASKINVLEDCTDGFMISEADLLQRGAGDFLGKEQSGRMNFKYADLVKDKKILNLAIQDAKELINNKMIKNYYLTLVDSDNFD